MAVILFKNYCHFYNIWVDYLVPLQIHLCGSRCSAHLSYTLLWFWEERAVGYRKPCKTLIRTDAGGRAPGNSSHSLLCSRAPLKISVKIKKTVSIYLLTQSLGSSVLRQFLLEATLFIYCNWGGCSAGALDAVGLHHLYKPWAAKQRLTVALCSLIRINGTRLPSALQ